MAAFRSRPPSDEAARATATAAELLAVLSGRTPTAPASRSQVRVLLVLEQRDGINLRTLAASLGTTPPSASRLCDRLESTGFLEREAAAADRREVRLRLSGSGRTFLADLRVRREREVRAVLAAMPVADREALREGLESFCAAAHRMLGKESGAGAVLASGPTGTERAGRRQGRPA
ncbi:MarR family transcriptional regulator [Streptomyces sp. LP11]|uniref:MarR family transcriptional regulator n=1 Tax=Streptomyces pyxinicus TaxID=2970331 RepID=A0ABT2B2H7_9ACTN|nr:MarR family transcriptional regulator [Streptomyces sp. LP11]MCS0602696.1 MarR family transcriptional regulator [Streptomyces sp. LP11]